MKKGMHAHQSLAHKIPAMKRVYTTMVTVCGAGETCMVGQATDRIEKGSHIQR